MAPRRAKPVEAAPEIDRVEGHPHPRETAHLTGQGDALGRAARAIRSGKPPQAWLISGPPGIGKATLAYRIARYLLRYGATSEGPDDLSVAANDPVAAQVAAASHPGLLILKRGLNSSGKMMTVLSVDEIRKLVGFFGMTSGAGGWRVAIIDTADDMNDNAANALLKALEEPPVRAMLLVLSHAPGRLLPTIRSRCQRLDLRPLALVEEEKELQTRLPDMSAKERASLARLSGGSIGVALQLASGDGLMLASEADKLIDNAAGADAPAILALADKIARVSDGLDSFGGFLSQAFADRILAKAASNAPDLDRWVALRERLNGSFARSGGLHMDPRQTIASAARAIAQTARRGAL
ncbi:MAG TPA: DNA polymerase III subunit delta' [Rhizomicrobium sp.]|jgi:DNA polymerase-3 subunit delta'|nr:DNA polymerase III subunit delta' [Rhizomicrobium sp.]